MAIEPARRTVAEFVTKWMIKEEHWKRSSDYAVVVLFPGEDHSSARPVTQNVREDH